MSSIQEERKQQIVQLIIEAGGLPLTRKAIGNALGFNSKTPSPYLITIISQLILEGKLCEVVVQTSKNRRAWGYISNNI